MHCLHMDSYCSKVEVFKFCANIHSFQRNEEFTVVIIWGNSFSLAMSASSLIQDEEDVFFDSYDYIHPPSDSASSEEGMVGSECMETNLRALQYEPWTKELMSIHERRRNFISGMGFDEFTSIKLGVSPRPEETVFNRMPEHNDLDRILSSYPEDHDCFIPQNDYCASLSTELYAVRKMEEKRNVTFDSRISKSRRWWRSFSMCKYDVSIKDGKMSPDTNQIKVQFHSKRCKGFEALHLAQEIQAHKGIIRTMKFNSSGSYLASGGEDCIVRIWQVEFDVLINCQNANEVKGDVLKFTRKVSDSSAHVAIAEKEFKIDEVAFQEFHGHSSDILDLCWSKSDYLLSSSKDKTVRLWKVGSTGCLRVFQHKNYVTCIQFNPTNDQYFVSGSIDGKIRIWGITENHVVEWVDNRDIVTAVCYQPNGEQGIVVGSIEGNCQIYSYSGDNLQLGRKLCAQSRKKLGKRITGLQFAPDNSQNLMITSADSTVHILDGVDAKKFHARLKARGKSTASFTSNGKYIVSVNKDSQVYLWNYEKSKSLSSRGIKLTCPCNTFHSEGVSVALPWPGMHLSYENMTKSYAQTSLEQKHVDQDQFSFGACFFPDVQSKSVTWPEEMLQDENQNHQHNGFKKPSNLVILIASYDGVIKTLLNRRWPAC
ncbi:WD repeat-containing protein 44-like isoform X4 [Dioscorea cayenensis subsp. rotundata]|uniref:WD repeat-containing protein 44-like isoform X4 n=1 Tax=Dioscorea cayennensis subsp. rotundata TaxID=55577 RepID=A0AB40CGL9_DIOCR|nr:WD repeat-containing protein 44-like isoform X4 [Dioscorea cayenensis subsp. rotundata]